MAQRGINPEQATKLFSGGEFVGAELHCLCCCAWACQNGPFPEGQHTALTRRPCCCCWLPLCLHVLCPLSIMAESISLDHANPNPAGGKGREDKPSAGPLSDDIHPPPTILNIDLVRMLDRHLSRAPPAAAAAAAEERPGGGGGSSGCGLSRASTDERLGSKGFGAGGGCGEKGAAAEGGATSSKGGGGGEAAGAACAGHDGGGGSGRLPRGSRVSGGVLDIGPTRTMHLQMTPMVSVCLGLLTRGSEWMIQGFQVRVQVYRLSAPMTPVEQGLGSILCSNSCSTRDRLAVAWGGAASRKLAELRQSCACCCDPCCYLPALLCLLLWCPRRCCTCLPCCACCCVALAAVRACPAVPVAVTLACPAVPAGWLL